MTTADGTPWPREAGALLVRGLFNTASREGKAALDDVRFYRPDSAFPIGYKPRRSRQCGALRLIEDLDLFDVSTGVLHGAHPLTGWSMTPARWRRRRSRWPPAACRSVSAHRLRHERLHRTVAQ